MWCDKFDMDLFKAIPLAADLLKPLEEVMLQTRGHETDGKLNRPSVWNTDFGTAAFFCFKPEGGVNLADPEPNGYWTNEPRVFCTAIEALRDCWPHHYALILSTEGRTKLYKIWDSQKLVNEFFLIMNHIRGIRTASETELKLARFKVYSSLCDAQAALLSLWEEQR